MASTSEKDQLEGRCYGVMQVVSLVCGTTFGVLPVVGTYAIVSFLTILVIALQVTYLVLGGGNFLLIGTDAQWELMKVGLRPSIAMFLLLWTVLYTCLHV